VEKVENYQKENITINKGKRLSRLNIFINMKKKQHIFGHYFIIGPERGTLDQS
jgi:hypothetical protein